MTAACRKPRVIPGIPARLSGPIPIHGSKTNRRWRRMPADICAPPRARRSLPDDCGSRGRSGPFLAGSIPGAIGYRKRSRGFMFINKRRSLRRFAAASRRAMSPRFSVRRNATSRCMAEWIRCRLFQISVEYMPPESMPVIFQAFSINTILSICPIRSRRAAAFSNSRSRAYASICFSNWRISFSACSGVSFR